MAERDSVNDGAAFITDLSGWRFYLKKLPEDIANQACRGRGMYKDVGYSSLS